MKSHAPQTRLVRRAGALLVSLAIVAAACGGDDDSSADDADETATESSSEPSATETSDAPQPVSSETSDAPQPVSSETSEAPVERTELTWISPRGSLDVMDDYPLWVAIDQGYFDELGLDIVLEPGLNDATATTKFVAEGQADVGFPSPGVLAASIDAGVEVTSIFGMVAGQVFNFATPVGSDIKTIADLEGATIAVPAAGLNVIVDPILVEAGIDPASVTYLEAGAQWGQATAAGQADAGLGWDGLRSQWAAQGIDVDWVLGKDSSQHPSNSYVVRRSDLDDPAMTDVWSRFLQGLVMGLEFGRANPAAAAQITYLGRADLAATVEPQLALESMLELASAYAVSDRAGNDWGWHDPEGWQNYLTTLSDLGQTSTVLDASAVYTNDLLTAANDIDLDRVQADAAAFVLNDDFAAVVVPADVEL